MNSSMMARLPDALVNSAHVTYLKSDAGATVERSGPVQRPSAEKVKQLESMASKDYQAGRFKDITDLFVPHTAQPDGPDPFEGKTVIDNSGKPTGLIIGSTVTPDGYFILDPSYGASRAASGAPDHAFFYHEMNFLTDAAEKYATLGENEVFRYRAIEDQFFVQDTLDFFTNGNYTASDVEAMQKQITAVVGELAQQIKNGESPDLHKLQTKLTIGGADVSFSQLLDFQKVGGALKEKFEGLTVGQMDTQSYAKMGIAKAMGNYYGSSQGAIGAMFSSAIDRLYERGVAQLDKTASWMESGNTGGYRLHLTDRERDAIKTSMNVRDIFSKLDTSSKEAFTRDFTATLATVRSMVQNHCCQFGVSTSYVGLAGDTADITRYFNQWMDEI